MTTGKMLDMISSWENLEWLTGEIMSNPDSLDKLMEVSLYSSHPKSWRAAWVADKIHDSRPELIVPYLEKMVRQLKFETHPGKKRQFLKLISLHDMPEKYHSFLVEYCLNCFMSGDEPVSVRVYGLQVLYNISEKQPLFKPELLSVIEHEMELHPAAGVMARGMKLAKELRRQI